MFGEEPSEGKVQIQQQVESELHAANSRIDAIQSQIDGINKRMSLLGQAARETSCQCTENGTVEDHPYAAPRRPDLRLARESSNGTTQSSFMDNDYSSSDADSDDLGKSEQTSPFLGSTACLETTQQVYEQAVELLRSLPAKEPPDQIENMAALYHLVAADARLRAQLTMQEIVKQCV